MGKPEFLVQTGWIARWQNERWDMPGWEVPGRETMPRNIPFPNPFGSRNIPSRILCRCPMETGSRNGDAEA